MLLDLKLKTAIERKQKGYKVFPKSGEVEIVEAETVAEAMEKTTIKNPIKIEKIGIIRKSLFSASELEEISKHDSLEVKDEIVVEGDSSKNSDTELKDTLEEKPETNHQDSDIEIEVELSDDSSNVNMSV